MQFSKVIITSTSFIVKVNLEMSLLSVFEEVVQDRETWFIILFIITSTSFIVKVNLEMSLLSVFDEVVQDRETWFIILFSYCLSSPVHHSL